VEQCSKVYGSVKGIFAKRFKDMPLKDGGTGERFEVKKLQKGYQIVEPILNRSASKAPPSLGIEAFGSAKLVRILIPNKVSCSEWSV